MINHPHINKEGSIPHKVGCGIMQRAALGGLPGINWPLSLVAQALLSLSSACCRSCMLSPSRSFAVNVSRGNRTSLKIPSHVSHLTWAVLDPALCLVPADGNEVPELLK